jgi:predicted transcriptional regulator
MSLLVELSALALRRPLTPSEALASGTRATLMAHVEASPGLPLSELRRRAAISWSNLVHHVAILERAGLLRTLRSGILRLVYPADYPADEDAALVRHAYVRAIALTIAARPGCGVRDVVAATGVSERRVYYHVRRLLSAGLITSATTWGYRDLRPTSRLLALLAT